MGETIVNSYIFYGLNKERNWLQAPTCECGCSEKMLLCLSSDNDLFEFCAAMLTDHDCQSSAIFIVRHDGRMQIAIYEPEEHKIAVAEAKNPSTHSFAEFDGEMHLCCYSLLIEKHPGEYLIAE